MIKNKIQSLIMAAATMMTTLIGFTSCVEDDDNSIGTPEVTISFAHALPDEISISDITYASITMRELNSGTVYTFNPIAEQQVKVRTGVYDYDGTIKATITDAVKDEATNETISSTSREKTLRVTGRSQSLAKSETMNLGWFFSNPSGTLVFSEIYAVGSHNAKATGGIRDTYLRIYNNTEEVIYLDGIGIAESAFVNARNSTHEILTPANNRNLNFTAGTVWVIPGNGTEHPLQPGQSIKIVDQAIDWSAQVTGALNHTDADFEWYDDNAQDTDNPDITNLDKWYCYSNTIWIISNQANRSYALVKFPDGMTSQEYLSDYFGGYEYISSTTGSHMTNDKAYLIPNDWILDGVNLGNAEDYVRGAMGDAVDISYACISQIKSDPNRFGNVFRRKVANVFPDGRVLLQDTNDSASDFVLEKP